MNVELLLCPLFCCQWEECDVKRRNKKVEQMKTNPLNDGGALRHNQNFFCWNVAKFKPQIEYTDWLMDGYAEIECSDSFRIAHSQLMESRPTEYLTRIECLRLHPTPLQNNKYILIQAAQSQYFIFPLIPKSKSMGMAKKKTFFFLILHYSLCESSKLKFMRWNVAIPFHPPAKLHDVAVRRGWTER